MTTWEDEAQAPDTEFGFVLDKPPRVPKAPPRYVGRIRWREVRDWCVANPGVTLSAAAVPKNAPYRLAQLYPELHVEGVNNRRVDNGRGGDRPVCDIHIRYDP